MAALVLAGELGGIGYDEITPEASAALGYAAGVRSDLLPSRPGRSPISRGGARDGCAACAGPPPEIVIAESSWESLRAPRATDSLLVFAEGDPATGSDDAWIHLGIVSVGAGSCPGGEAGMPFGRRPGAAGPGGDGPGHAGGAGPARRGDADAVLPVGWQVLVRHAVGEHRRGDHPGRRAARRQLGRRARAYAGLSRRRRPPDLGSRRRCGRSRSRCSASPASRFTAATCAARWWTASRSLPGWRPATAWPVTPPERGMALPLALFALVVIGAMVAGGFAAALLEQRIGRNTAPRRAGRGGGRGRRGGGGGRMGRIRPWAARPGDSSVMPAIPLPGLAAYSPTVIRLNRSCSWCESPACAATGTVDRWPGGKSGCSSG